MRVRPPPPIASPEWDQELEALGISRALVDALLRDVLGDADLATITAHDLSMRVSYALDDVPDGALAAELRAWGREPSRAALTAEQELALVAAGWFLFHEMQPIYAALMHFRLDVQRGTSWRTPLGRWCARQLAAGLLHGGPKVAESMRYYLAVDPFEVAGEAIELFPLLVDELPPALHEALLAGSSHVTWPAKRDFYARCANDPALHASLAAALHGSIRSGFYTSVEPYEALALLRRIELPDAARRAAIEEGLTRPIRAFVAAVAEVDERRFNAQFPGACLVALAWLDESPPCWLWGSELWAGQEFLGRFLRHRQGSYSRGECSLPLTIVSETSAPPPERAQPSIDWHAVWGPARELAGQVGAVIELVGAGLR